MEISTQLQSDEHDVFNQEWAFQSGQTTQSITNKLTITSMNLKRKVYFLPNPI